MKPGYELVDCPTCGKNNIKKLIFERDDGINFFRCLSCNIEYSSPRLKEKELLRLYQNEDWKDLKDYENWTYENWKSSKATHYHLVAKNVELVKKYIGTGSRVLDLGCDIGLTIRWLIEEGYKSEGIEVSKIGFNIAKNKTKVLVHNCQIQDVSFNYKFDGILVLDVLEHLYDPVNVLNQANRTLKTNGLIFIHVPNHQGISVRFKKLLHKLRLKKSFKHFGFPAHIYNFDKKSLTKILGKAGFEVIHFESWPRSMTEGKLNLFNRVPVSIISKFALSDYIICVARKI